MSKFSSFYLIWIASKCLKKIDEILEILRLHRKKICLFLLPCTTVLIIFTRKLFIFLWFLSLLSILEFKTEGSQKSKLVWFKSMVKFASIFKFSKTRHNLPVCISWWLCLCVPWPAQADATAGTDFAKWHKFCQSN